MVVWKSRPLGHQAIYNMIPTDLDASRGRKNYKIMQVLSCLDVGKDEAVPQCHIHSRLTV